MEKPISYEDLKRQLAESGRSYDMELIDGAYALAEKAHSGVCRRSGEPYITHPLSVASLLIDLGLDSASISAALLHDVVEDTEVTKGEIASRFGDEVANLVDGVTKTRPDLLLDDGGAAGRKPAQDAAGDESGHPGHDHQAL